MAHSFICVRRRAASWLLTALLAVMARPALANIDVRLSGVEDELRSNILLFLSVERYRSRDDVDEDTMQRLHARVEDEVIKAVRPLGYYEPQVASSVEQQGKDWRVEIHVTPGEPVRVRELKIEIQGPGADDPVFDGIRTQNVLRVGMRLHHGLHDDVRGEMQKLAAANGYLAARMVEHEMLVDPATHTAGIALVMDTGPRYAFGDINIDQSVIRPQLMERFVRFREGEPYNVSQVLQTQFALDDSLYFSRVDVTPGEPDPESLTVPVTISAAKSRPVLSLGAGYGTDTKARGTLTWTDARVNDRGHRLRFELRLSEITRRIDARYDIPIGDPALEKFSLELSNELDDISGVDTDTTVLKPSVTHVRGRWQTVTSMSLTRTDAQDGSPTTELLVPGLVLASVPEGFLGEALFSRAFYAEALGSTTALGARTDFVSLRAQSEHTFDLNYYWHLFARAEAGTIFSGNFDDVELIYKFFAGGDRSVRGFGYRSLSPTQIVIDSQTGLPTEQPTGGKHLVTGTLELIRDLPRNLAVAGFVDAGNAFNNWKDGLEYSVGLGVRYRLPVLSLGIDVAKPISTGGDYRLHLNITPKL